MYLIDTHAHIYLSEFDGDREQMLERSRSSGIQKVLMPAIDSSTHQKMLEIEARYEGCMSMIGLHPCSVKEDFGQELDIVADYLTQRKFVAIGEIGLDFYWDVAFSKQQYDAFHKQISMAMEYNLPIVIHSRSAIDECIEVVQQYPGLKGVFHCFSGNEVQAQKIVELDFLLGIGGVVSFKNAGLDKVVATLGLKNIILETDAPYLSPVPYRGKRNEVSYTKLIAEKLSQVTGQGMDAIAEITTANANKLFMLEQGA